MNLQIVQGLREKLARRIERLMSANMDMFPAYLKQFWEFFHNNSIYSSIACTICAKYPDSAGTARVILNGDDIFSTSEEENAAIAYQVIKILVESISTPNDHYPDIDSFENAIIGIDAIYSRVPSGSTSKSLDTFRSIFIKTFHDYVDEQLDEQKIVLSMLLRYKHRSEWFHRDELAAIVNDSRRAEKLLALNLYSYLYDQGVNFHIEPSSITGEIDLIASQESNDPLLADAKIFDADARSKSYLRKGFNQIYTYTQQYNEPCGYLIVFRITKQDLNFAVSQRLHGVAAVTYNHKTIFLLTIDICPHDKPVSQRKPLQSITITEEELITPVEDANTVPI
jgi:hypothetical protein